MDLLLPLIIAAVVTVALVPLLERKASLLHVMDGPGPRKVHERPIPRVGGIAMAVGAAIPLLIWLPIDRQWASYLFGGAIILIFGVLDDRYTLPAGLKLAGQFIGVGCAVLIGGLGVHSVYLGGVVELPAGLAAVLAYAFVLGITNAINLADGLDGLAGGTSALSFAALVALTFGTDQGGPILVAVVMLGALLGFLRYNSYPARIFMGDGGSQLLGYTLGVLALLVTQGAGTAYSAALPLLVLGLPLIDMLAVIVMRLREGRSPFVADQNHLHHRLLDLGFDHFEAVALIYLLQVGLLLLAWFMRFQPDVVVLAAFVTVAIAAVGSVLLAQRAGWHWRAPEQARLAAVLQHRMPRLLAPEHLPRWASAIALGLITAYVLGIASTTSSISADVAWLGLALVLVMAAAATGKLPLDLMRGPAQAAAYVTVLMVVYLDHVEPPGGDGFGTIKRVLFPALALTLIVRLRLWRERRFTLTTLDLLIVVIALIVPNLPGLQAAAGNVAIGVAKVVILLYAVELLHAIRWHARLWACLAGGLAVAVVRHLQL